MKISVFSGKPFYWISVLVIVALALAACQPAAQNTEPPMATEPAMEPSPMAEATETEVGVPATGSDAMAEAVTVNVASDPQYGDILVDGAGMTLYMFTRDEPNVSNCADQCLEAWPPLVADGGVTAGPGVDDALFGEADLPDGRKIVTYNGMPLYYWVNDRQPGDTSGQGVNDVWYVVSPEGEMIDAPMTGAAADDSMDDPMMEDGPVIEVASDPALGEFLVDGDGMTLYMFTRDEPNVSNCAEQCLEAWPPLVAEGEVRAGEGVEDDLFGEADLPDGRKIVTYNEMPLYYWVNDKEPGDTTGQGVNDVWYVVSPDGNPIGAGQ